MLAYLCIEYHSRATFFLRNNNAVGSISWQHHWITLEHWSDEPAVHVDTQECESSKDLWRGLRRKNERGDFGNLLLNSTLVEAVFTQASIGRS